LPGRQWRNDRDDWNEVEVPFYGIAAQNNYFLKRHSEICRKGLTKKFRKKKYFLIKSERSGDPVLSGQKGHEDSSLGGPEKGGALSWESHILG